MEAGISQNELSELFEALRNKHAGAFESRRRVAAAKGLLDSGAMQKWGDEWSEDEAQIEDLEAKVTEFMEPTDNLSHEALAKRTVSLDRVKREIDTLFQKYIKWAESDDRDRAKLHASKMAEFQAGRTSSPP